MTRTFAVQMQPYPTQPNTTPFGPQSYQVESLPSTSPDSHFAPAAAVTTETPFPSGIDIHPSALHHERAAILFAAAAEEEKPIPTQLLKILNDFYGRLSKAEGESDGWVQESSAP